jgi:hypothetical protein
VVLTIAVFSLLVTLSYPVYRNFQVRNDTEIAVNIIVQTIRRAQRQAFASQDESDWGILVGNSAITLFQGSSFATRNSSFDEVFTFSTELTLSGMQEVVFQRLSGIPNINGTLTIRNAINEPRSIIINEKGVVEY